MESGVVARRALALLPEQPVGKHELVAHRHRRRERRSARCGAAAFSARTLHPELYALCRWPSGCVTQHSRSSSNLSRVRFNPQTATTQGDVQRITTGPRDLSQLEVSPNGGQVLVGPSPFQQEDLYLLAPDGGGFMQLTNDRARDRGPRFSPDGLRVLFNSDRGGSLRPCLVDLTSTAAGLRRLTTTEGRYYPVPSPDGKRLLVADINNFALFVIDANDPSKALEVLPPFPEALRGVNFVPQDWSPDGKTIIGYSAPHVWAYSFETRGIQPAHDQRLLSPMVCRQPAVSRRLEKVECSSSIR